VWIPAKAAPSSAHARDAHHAPSLAACTQRIQQRQQRQRWPQHAARAAAAQQVLQAREGWLQRMGLRGRRGGVAAA
jgi:hypothetical protein